jgi:Domain of unknown function (DUF4105)
MVVPRLAAVALASLTWVATAAADDAAPGGGSADKTTGTGSATPINPASATPINPASDTPTNPGSATPTNSDPAFADMPVIELVTMGVGSKIWERHGHIVLCVRERDPRQDRCYNYGIGDFYHPLQMGWGFFRGTNSFWAGAEPPSQMLYIYRYTDRTIWSQPLPLTPEQKQKVIAKLERDVLEENKFYAYDHFWDNCTTRVRDILDDATGGKLSAMREPTDGRTYRDLAREGFYGMRVPLVLTDIAMGRVTDRVPTYYERMFLPEYLREAATKLWGVQPRVVYQRQGPPSEKHGPSGRGWLALGILALTAPVWLTRRWGHLQRTALALALLPQFVLGVVFWTLAIISPLSYVHWNETCLVFLPLDLAMLILPAAAARGYARARVVMLLAMAAALAVGVLKQPLWAPLLAPLIPALAVGFLPRRAAGEAAASAAALSSKSKGKGKRNLKA